MSRTFVVRLMKDRKAQTIKATIYFHTNKAGGLAKLESLAKVGQPAILVMNDPRRGIKGLNVEQNFKSAYDVTSGRDWH